MNHTRSKRDFGEEGFAEHYNARIRPRLAELEAMRYEWLRRWRATMTLTGAIAVGLAVWGCARLFSILREVFSNFLSFGALFFLVFCIFFFIGALYLMFPGGPRKWLTDIYDFFTGDKLHYYSGPKYPKSLTPKKKEMLLLICLIGAFAVGMALFASARHDKDAKPFFLFFPLVLSVSASRGIALKYRRKLKEALIPIIFDFFKDNKLQYHTSQGEPIGLREDISIRGTREVARKLYSYTDLMVDDGFTGTYLGYDFLIDEVVITKTTSYGEQSKTVTLFRGLVLGIAGNRLFADDVLLRRRGQTPNGEKFQRVHLEDVRFENKFDAFGTDQIAVRRLLEPMKMELIMAAVGRISTSGTPEFMFLKDGFFLFIPSDKNHFEPGGITTSVYETDTIKKILTDIRVVLSLIEILQEEKILPEKAHD